MKDYTIVNLDIPDRLEKELDYDSSPPSSNIDVNRRGGGAGGEGGGGSRTLPNPRSRPSVIP